MNTTDAISRRNLARTLAAPAVSASIGLGMGACGSTKDGRGARNASSKKPIACPVAQTRTGQAPALNTERLIGRKLPQAAALAQTHGCTVRV